MIVCQVNHMTTMLLILILPFPRCRRYTSILNISSSAQKPLLAPLSLPNQDQASKPQCLTQPWLYPAFLPYPHSVRASLRLRFACHGPRRLGCPHPSKFSVAANPSSEAQPKSAAPSPVHFHAASVLLWDSVPHQGDSLPLDCDSDWKEVS